MEMKVSILVPVYGVEKYIERCAKSLFDQTYENIEYIFVNDCTKDNSVAVLKDVINTYPYRKTQTKIINHEHNLGLGGARNTAVAAATGDYIIHVDSDDYIDKTAIEKLVAIAIDRDADIVALDISDIYHTGIVVEKEPCFTQPTEYVYNTILHTIRNGVCGRLIRRSLYTENDICVPEGISMAEDLIVTPRLYYFSKSVAALHEPLYFYDHTNEGSLTQSFSEKKASQMIDTLNYLEEYFELINKEVLEAVRIRKVRAYAATLTQCCKDKGHADFYYRTLEILKREPRYLIKKIPLSRLLPYYIGNYFFSCLCVRIAYGFYKMFIKK